MPADIPKDTTHLFYVADDYIGTPREIREAPIKKVTAAQVRFDEHVYGRVIAARTDGPGVAVITGWSSNTRFFLTREDARNHAVQVAEDRVVAAINEVDRCRANLDRAKGLS